MKKIFILLAFLSFVSHLAAQQSQDEMFEKFKIFMQQQRDGKQLPSQQSQDEMFEKFKIFLQLQENENKTEAAKEDVKKETKEDVLELTETQKENFKKEAANAIEDLMSLINQIAYAQNSNQQKNDAISAAIALFLNEEKVVEITSVKTPSLKNFYKIREYLNRLKRLMYSNVKYTAYDIGFANDFKKGTDGNYYAEAVFCQLFQAKTKATNNEFNKYQEFNIKDVTCKRVTIVLERVEVLGSVEYILKLGDIYVEDYGRS